MTTKFRKSLGENTLVEIKDGDLFITQIDGIDNGVCSYDVVILTPKQLLDLLVYLHELPLEVKHEMMSDIGEDPVELKMTPV